MTIASFCVFTVSGAELMVAVGLKATRKLMSAPFVIPPWTPPERFAVIA
jgi:hypothetical protein